VHSIIKFFAPS